MLQESKMLSKTTTTLGRRPRALLMRYALTTWRRCKQGMVDEFFSAEDAGPSEDTQRKFWRKNTVMVAADSIGVFHWGLLETQPGCAPSLRSRFCSSNISNLRDSLSPVAPFPNLCLGKNSNKVKIFNCGLFHSFPTFE